jgi:hypothetical protein
MSSTGYGVPWKRMKMSTPTSSLWASVRPARRPTVRSLQRQQLEGLEVDEQDPVDQPAVVRLIRNALDFRRADGMVVMAGPERIAVRLGEQAFVRTKDKETKETDGPLTRESLALLEEQGLPLREVLAH